MLRQLAVCLAISLMLSGLALQVLGLPHPQPVTAKLQSRLNLDVFDDTIRYDDGVVQWWYGGMHNFYLITRFTAPADFVLQGVAVALLDSNTSTPINLWLKEDVFGEPGPVLWAGSLLYDSPNTWLGVTLDTTDQFVFAAGQSFWLELFSPGPPYECYDSTQPLPPRSFTGYPNPSPGDNFIRAVGEYTAALVDVGVDSIWHGGMFFCPDSGDYQVGCRAWNYGSAAVSFTVSCSLYTWDGAPLAGLESQTISLDPGASTNVYFAPFTYDVVGSYVFCASSNLAGDLNPDNNSAQIETQIYTVPPPAGLTYDDGLPNGAAVTPIPGNGWGMKFDPHQNAYYRVDSVKVCVDLGGNNLPARIQLMRNDPTSNAPGPILWQAVLPLCEGWNAFSVDTCISGPIYVGYLFENGENSPALDYDHPPTSGECWAMMDGVWSKGTCLNDWMMRVVIDTSGGPTGPQLWVSLTPNGPTTIPPEGGTLNYTLTGGNSGTSGQSVDVWITLTMPNGSTRRPVLGPFFNLPMEPGFSISRNRSLTVRPGAPAGQYALNAFFGDYNPPNNTILAADTLYFLKAGARTGVESVWLADNERESQDGTNLKASPLSFQLHQNFPNPFNAKTAISFELQAPSYVSLRIYDSAGRLVQTLIDGWREEGSQEVSFDASNLASGIYVYGLKAGDLTAGGKMVLVK